MDQLGLITSEKRDSFNFLVYASSLQDFKEVVEADGSFTMNKLEIFNGGSPLVVNQPDDAAEVGRALANSCRNAGGVLIDAHIGEHLSNELFSRVEQRSSRHAKEITGANTVLLRSGITFSCLIRAFLFLIFLL
ncbi:unnamed protein product [Prunus armeniaca]